MPAPRNRSVWTKPIIAIVAGVFIVCAVVAAFKGWLPLNPKNDLTRSLQRLGNVSSPHPGSFLYSEAEQPRH
jgi:hypothetical protein